MKIYEVRVKIKTDYSREIIKNAYSKNNSGLMKGFEIEDVELEEIDGEDEEEFDDGTEEYNKQKDLERSQK